MAPKQESHGPRLTPVIVLGLLSFLLGGFLGTISLVTRPVTTYRKAPDPESLKPGEVYFLRGDRGGASSWRAKEEAWRTGQVDRLILTEAELNEWSRARMDPADRDSGTDEDSGWLDKMQLTASPVDFRILEDGLQVATELELPELFPNSTYICQFRGRLTAGPDGLQFRPQEGTLGRAPLGSVPGTRELLYHFVRSRFSGIEPIEWLAESLGEVESVEIGEDHLILRRATAG